MSFPASEFDSDSSDLGDSSFLIFSMRLMISVARLKQPFVSFPQTKHLDVFRYCSSAHFSQK